jgi:hypothetical protein
VQSAASGNNTITQDAASLNQVITALSSSVTAQRATLRNSQYAQAKIREATVNKAEADVAQAKISAVMDVIQTGQDVSNKQQVVLSALSSVQEALQYLLQLTNQATGALAAKLSAVGSLSDQINQSLQAYIASGNVQMQQQVTLGMNELNLAAQSNVNQAQTAVLDVGTQLMNSLAVQSSNQQGMAGFASSQSAALIALQQQVAALGTQGSQQFFSLLASIESGTSTLTDALNSLTQVDVSQINTVAGAAKAFLDIMNAYITQVAAIQTSSMQSVQDFETNFNNNFAAYNATAYQLVGPILANAALAQSLSANVSSLFTSSFAANNQVLANQNAAMATKQKEALSTITNMTRIVNNATSTVNRIFANESSQIKTLVNQTFSSIRALLAGYMPAGTKFSIDAAYNYPPS